MVKQRRRLVTNIDLIGGADGERDSYSFEKLSKNWKTYLMQCAKADLVVIDNEESSVIWPA